MDRARSLFRIFVLSLVTLGLGLRASEAQMQPPDMPRDLISQMVPYEQGIANILAQDAARPKAVQPILPGPPNAPANAATSNQAPPTGASPEPK
jgi:hypothetical protein